MHEFGEVHNGKIIWDNLEIRYNMKWSEKFNEVEGVFLVGNLQKDADIEKIKVVEESIKLMN